MTPSSTMPLDIALSTNTPTAMLALQQAQPLGDGEHLAAFLVVRSGGFASALPFLFTQGALQVFLYGLTEGHGKLMGRESSGWLEILSSAGSHADVRGELSDEGQLLRFRFSTPREGIDSLRDGAAELLAT